MYNYFALVGRLKAINKNSVVLNVDKPYKNKQGIFETETFEVQLNDKLMSIVNLEEGNFINIKGRISKDENTNIILIGERMIVERGIIYE